MKPPPFEYFSPTSVDECVSLLAEHGEDAKLLAGGQSLVPLMNLRLAAPEVLIDLNGVAELARVTTTLDAEIVVAGPGGRRSIPARDFFAGHFTTVLEPSELLIEVRF